MYSRQRRWIYLALVLAGSVAFCCGVLTAIDSRGTLRLASSGSHAGIAGRRFLSYPQPHSEHDPFSEHSLWAQRLASSNDLNNFDRKTPDDFDRAGDPWNGAPLTRQANSQINFEQIIVRGAIFLVFLIGCANLGGQIIREGDSSTKVTASRRGESREQIVWRSLSESLMLAILGGGAGLCIAALSGSSFWRAQYIFFSAGYSSPRLRIIILTLSVCVIAGVLFGILPAMRAGRRKLAPSRRSAYLGVTFSSSPFFRRTLIATELILMLALLTGTGYVLGRSLHAPPPTRAIPGRVTI